MKPSASASARRMLRSPGAARGLIRRARGSEAEAEADADAEKVRTRLLHGVDERRDPKTRATVNQMLDRYLETLDVEPTTAPGKRASSVSTCAALLMRGAGAVTTGGNISVMSEAQGLPVVLLSGWPGSGKSTVGRTLAGRLSAALVDQDTVTGPLVAVVADMVGVHDLDDVRLAAPTRDARYETIAAVAEENLRAGIPVVLVAPFSRERRNLHAWEALDRRLRAAGGSPLLVWLHLEPMAVVGRLKARGAARDLAKVADPGSFLARLDQGAPVGPHVVVNAERAAADVVEQIVALLSANPT